MHIMNVHTYACLPGSLWFWLFIWAFVWAVLWLELSIVLSGVVRPPEMWLWGFLCSLAMPGSLMTIWWPRQWQLLWERARGGGKARQGLISEEAKDVYEALPLTVLTPIRHSVEIRHHFDSTREYADYLSLGFSPLVIPHELGNNVI